MRFILGVLLAVSPLACFSQDYSGVWSFGLAPSSDYFTINQNSSELLVSWLDVETGSWKAYQGELEGTEAALSSIYFPNGECSTLRLNFESDVLSNSSISVVPCPSSEGAVGYSGYAFYFTMHKVF
ncbi:MAG: hypothetical protein R3332_00500 [Pseudohongiellaceae bacterium]|nr:hypothetical protein [Pseudohongiellaceae bacterium]